MDYLKKNLHWLLESGRVLPESLASKLSLPVSSVRKGDVRYIENWLLIAELSGFSLDTLAHVDLSQKERPADSKIKLLTLDVDGVLTEGGMYYAEDGNEFKRFHTRDGMGIRLAVNAGITVGFISHGKNEKLIRSRAEHLGVSKVYVGKEPKWQVLQSWAKELGIPVEACAHIGDEINDLEIMDKVGLSACPSDAMEVVKKNAKVLLRSRGGEGCVREFIENYLLMT